VHRWYSSFSIRVFKRLYKFVKIYIERALHQESRQLEEERGEKLQREVEFCAKRFTALFYAICTRKQIEEDNISKYLKINAFNA
jgi:hypothetical protein